MESEGLKKKLEEYTELIAQIRSLTAVNMDVVDDPDAYADHLRDDYAKVSELGSRGRAILKETVNPYLKGEEAAEPEVLNQLQEFCHLLLEPASGEELDLFLLFEVSRWLLTRYEEMGDRNGLVRQLDMHISVCYANVNRTARITSSRDLCTSFRDDGLRAAARIRELFFDREVFLTLDEEARIAALRGIRFYSALWDTWYAEPETNTLRYEALADALRVAQDPFYLANVKDYRWDRHTIRCIEHMGQLTERGNRWGFTPKQCEEICGWLTKLRAMWEQDPEKVESIVPRVHLELILHRNTYYAGRMKKEDYRAKLIDLYDRFATDVYDMYGVQMNLLIPAEILTTFRDERATISAASEALIRRIYDRVIQYVLKSVNADAFNYLQEYLVAFLENYIEFPGNMTFEEAGMRSLSALHPPTYIHSIQVARLARCLCGHLIRRDPDRLTGVCGTKNADEVQKKIKKIQNRIWHGGLCHDFGKLCMIDTIFVYGRTLLEDEEKILRAHPRVGASMLSMHGSCRAYADMALGHHLWYDGSDGYPDDFDIASCPDRVLIEILTVADALDAATDAVGRSYRMPVSKTLPQLLPELFEGAGTRYAPYVVELLKDEAVREDVEFLLGEDREANYRDTWLLLKDMQMTGEV